MRNSNVTFKNQNHGGARGIKERKMRQLLKKLGEIMRERENRVYPEHMLTSHKGTVPNK